MTHFFFPKQHLTNRNYGIVYATKSQYLSFKWDIIASKCDYRSFLVIHKASCISIRHNNVYFHNKHTLL